MVREKAVLIEEGYEVPDYCYGANAIITSAKTKKNSEPIIHYSTELQYPNYTHNKDLSFN